MNEFIFDVNKPEHVFLADFDRATRVVEGEYVRVDLTEEQIGQIDFLGAVVPKFIGANAPIFWTLNADATRQKGAIPIYSNNIQLRQLGRAIALVDQNVYQLRVVNGAHFELRTVNRAFSRSDRVVIGEELPLNPEAGITEKGFYAYTSYYGLEKHNQLGEVVGLVRGLPTAMGSHIQNACAKYNAWVDEKNAEMMALRDTALRAGMEEIEAARQFPTRRHINPASVYDKYTLTGAILAAHIIAQVSGIVNPTLEIYVRPPQGQTHMSLAQAQYIESVLREAYVDELRALAGLPFIPRERQHV